MALALTAFAWYGAEAKDDCKKKRTSKSKAKTVRVAPKQNSVVRAEACRTLPYEVCKILPDRRSVSCYKTTDLAGLTPLPYETTFYGPTGKLPGEAVNHEVETIVVKGAPLPDHCRKGSDLKTTVCYNGDMRLTRDAFGFYSYR